MAYLMDDRASSDAGKAHLAWSRLTVLSACVAFWIAAGLAIHATL